MDLLIAHLLFDVLIEEPRGEAGIFRLFKNEARCRLYRQLIEFLADFRIAKSLILVSAIAKNGVMNTMRNT